ncbi:MAG: prolyl-tRNA synthetase associated domain-containing protein [Agathobacter sp.]
MRLVKGRPECANGRLEKEKRTYDLLDALNISFERIDHEAVYTMEACEEIDRALATAVICKNLFLCNAQKTSFYLLMIPGTKKFVTREVSTALGSSRLSFAPPEYMEQYLDITPGSVSVLGLMNDKDNKVQLVVDEEIYQSEYFGCHPCINTSSLRLRTADLFDVFLPAIHHKPIIIHI